MNFRTLDHDVAHAALIDLVQQLRERDVLRGGALARILEQREQRQQQQDDDHPEGEIAQIGVHQASFTRRARGAAAIDVYGRIRGDFTSRPVPNVGTRPAPAKERPRISTILARFRRACALPRSALG